MDEFWVYDPMEERSWGPFATNEEADEFIESDKYLQSWGLVKLYPKDTTYPPEAYHGEWPLER
jgi:hypothetical protein